MQSVSDWTEQNAGFGDSFRPEFTVTASTSFDFSGDMLVVPFYKPKDLKEDTEITKALKDSVPIGLTGSVSSMVTELLDDGEFKADAGSKKVVRIVGADGVGIKYICLVGLGPDPKKDGASASDMETKSANRLGKAISAAVKEMKVKSAGVVIPVIANAGVTQMLLGVYDDSYNDNRFKKVPDGGFKNNYSLTSLSLVGVSEKVAADAAITSSLTKMIASGVQQTKDLVGAPPNSKTPLVIANLAKKMATEHGMECKVLGEEECKALNMGGYLGVQQGSKFPPQFVHLTYKPSGVSQDDIVKVALVGKGLTFDSGGYNLKAGAGSMIELMKFDMGGCGTVLGTAKAIAQLKPKNVEVHFITALCENMISTEAMRPGDVLTASNGKTIEVLNTDAEGRLTLADALVYADNLKADVIVDMATLTGAQIVALGEKIAAVYSPDDQLRADLQAAALRSDEGLWPLPLAPEYKELLKSSLADLKNIGGKGGGSITAALFCQEFVGTDRGQKWAHIDMAGPVWDTKESKPTGYGVKTMTDFLLNLRK